MNQKSHGHTFVEQYEGLVGFGFDRETDEKSLMVYLQKFSDDALLAALVPRLSDSEIQDLFERISLLLKKHLREAEYHGLFLKDENA
jgi:TorA maturation chaperone TorD